ncbi:MAG: hypothetical protein FIB07_16395 [Candidatus Methanoperedens sp.]|nr:hypothetical protein [Candidatus Methanoperedens sp.]
MTKITAKFAKNAKFGSKIFAPFVFFGVGLPQHDQQYSFKMLFFRIKGLKDTRNFSKKPSQDKQHSIYCIESLKNMPKNSFYIDSCIFLGTVIKDDNSKACKSFISRVDNGIYIGYISPFVTGELINSILYAQEIKVWLILTLIETCRPCFIQAGIIVKCFLFRVSSQFPFSRTKVAAIATS